MVDLHALIPPHLGLGFVGYAKLWDLVGTRPLEQGTGRLGALDGRGIRFVHTRIRAIDPERCAVDTTAGAFDADYMIVALGAAADRGKLGSAERGQHDLYDPEQLPAMRLDLGSLESGTVVISVLGMPYVCPPAPYEAGFLVEEHLRRRSLGERVGVVITTPMPSPLPVAGPEVDEMVADRLARLGIDLRTGVEVSQVDAERLRRGARPSRWRQHRRRDRRRPRRALRRSGLLLPGVRREAGRSPRGGLLRQAEARRTDGSAGRRDYARKEAFEAERLGTWLDFRPSATTA